MRYRRFKLMSLGYVSGFEVRLKHNSLSLQISLKNFKCISTRLILSVLILFKFSYVWNDTFLSLGKASSSTIARFKPYRNVVGGFKAIHT